MKMKVVLALLVLVGVSGPLQAQSTFTRKGQATPSGKFEVFNVAGTVTVSAWDRPEFSVDATMDSGVDRVDVSSNRGVNTIRVVLKDRVVRPWNEHVSAYLDIRIPAGSTVEVHATSAATSVQGVTGPLRLHSVSGSTRASGFGREIDVKTVSGRVDIQGSGSIADVRVETVSGGISIRDAVGKVDVETTSGRVDLPQTNVTDARVATVSGSVSIAGRPAADAVGRFDVKTTSGRLDLTLGRVADVSARTVSGSISIAGQLEGGARVEASSVSGSVVVDVSGAQGFRYDLSSYSGSLRTCFDGGVSAKRQLSGRRAGGAGDVRVRSFSGSVQLCDSRANAR